MAEFWLFRPLDTLFFRDGSPFNAGEGSQMGVAGTFPPSMRTLQGAIRALLARQAGWREGETSKWPASLGDENHLGELVLRGPYLGVKRDEGWEWLFPAPAHLLRLGNVGPVVRLAPSKEGVLTDFSAQEPVRLPRPVGLPDRKGEHQSLKDVQDRWVTATGLQQVLAGEVPHRLIRPSELWAQEPRVGIARERTTRTAAEGQIYSSVHTRLRKEVALAVRIEQSPIRWQPDQPAVITLSGQSRMATVEPFSAPDAPGAPAPLPPAPSLEPTGNVLRFTITLVTPGVYSGADAYQVVRYGPDGIPGRVISACVGRLGQQGGWDIRNRRPRPLKPVLPPGTTWFYEADKQAVEAVRELHGRCLGPEAEYGFGQVVVGKWEEYP